MWNTIVNPITGKKVNLQSKKVNRLLIDTYIKLGVVVKLKVINLIMKIYQLLGCFHMISELRDCQI